MIRILFFTAMLLTFAIYGANAAQEKKVQIEETSITSCYVDQVLKGGVEVGKHFLSESQKQCGASEDNAQEKVARSGCCSWHGGICGCSSSGRAVCCDGQLSPSCGC